MSCPGLNLPPGKHHSRSSSSSDFLFPINIFFFEESKIIPSIITSNCGVFLLSSELLFSMIMLSCTCFYLFRCILEGYFCLGVLKNLRSNRDLNPGHCRERAASLATRLLEHNFIEKILTFKVSCFGFFSPFLVFL